MDISSFTELPDTYTPISWLTSVLPCSRETYDHHLTRTKQVLTDLAFDRELSLVASDDRGPLGIVIITGKSEKRQLELIALRGDRRQRGYGKTLLQKTIDHLQTQNIQALTVSNVSSANTAYTHLLKSSGFKGKTTSGVRMRRSLDMPLPEYTEPEGFTIRALQHGEEKEWVRMKNAAFAEEGGKPWTLDNFHRTFTNEACCDYNRILVALKGDFMVATTSAWEIDYGEGPVGLIHWVGTDPKYRGHGLGYALSLRALEELAARGYADAWLNTSYWRGAAVRLYERLDFHVHRRTVHYSLDLSQ